MNHTNIAKQLDISRNQVTYTLCTPYIEPKKAAGGPPTLSPSDAVRIEAFITSSSEGRRMSWFELAHGPFRDFGVSERVIQNELKKRGYGFRPALKKPPLSEEVKRKRREQAEAHKDWTVEDWMAILWTDETWASDGQHKREWVTRKILEDVNATCVVEKERKSLGWMFWGSFAGVEEGPCLFWKKEWGSITPESYSHRIVPLIVRIVSMRPWVSVMQDNAPSHSAAGTIEEFRKRFITPIDWPPYSPNLNPIEHVWDSMKDYVQYHYPRLERGRQRSYDEPRGIVKEAWNDATKPDKLEKLIRSMPTRCEAVILAEGGPVKY